MKSLFTYEERLASLLITRHYLDATRRSHFKAVIIVADFSEKSNFVDSNDIECLTCFLRLYSEYYTFESLKKHLRDASHCSLAQQLQQEVESKIVEKSKIESSSASLVKSLSTYENRLASLDKWRNVDSKEILVFAEFSDTNIWFMTQCTHCSIEIFDVDREEESLKHHLRKSSQCSLVLQLEKKTSEVIVEVAKLISVAADIGFFDATLACDIQEFSLFCEIAGFVQQLRQCQHQYRESDLLTLLFECFRDSALTWYKQQRESESEIVKKNLSEWLETLITVFSAKSSKSETSSASSASFSPQYHSCLNCFAFFSSLTRLLQHNQIICQKVVCKQCEKIFDSKNKLHEHIRQHHVKSAKEVVKDASRRSFNREKDKSSTTISQTITIFSSKLTKTTTKISISRSVTPPERSENSPTSLVTSATSKQLFWSRIASTSVISSRRSRLSLSTFNIVSKRVKITSTTCSLTSFATSSSRLRKLQKSHLTIDDLIRMFAEKSRSFDLSQHQDRRTSSQSIDARQSRSSSTYQSRIIAYFLSAVNQKTSISQDLKSSKSKTFQQRTLAELISLCRSVLSEKSVFSSYKKSDFSHISLHSRFSFLQSRFSFAWSLTSSSYFWSSHTSSSLLESSPSDSHVCCICFDRFSFRNDSFNYRRFSQRYLSNRRSIEEIWER